jgi:hypothetical protein
VDRRHTLARHDLSSLIIDQLDLGGFASPPPEAKTPLILYSDAPLPGPVATQPLQPVSRRNPEIFQRHRRIHYPELAQGYALNGEPPRPDRLTMKEAFRVAVTEGADHDPC